RMQEWIPLPKLSLQPLREAVTVFTDAGRRSRRAAAVWHNGTRWCQHLLDAEEADSLQTLELFAVVLALCIWQDTPVNIVTDSMYVAGVAQQIESACIKELQNQRLYQLL
ncbi:POK19 protein, partial [Onychorhynchus coronatus]|nr:POK19 protein [Onychorhynchus coronatus]